MEPAWVALALSLKVAGFATAINTCAGIAVGLLLARRRFIGRDLLDALLTLPMVLPPTVLGYYLLVLLGRKGWLGGWLAERFGIHLIFTWQGAVIAASAVAFPLVMKSARAAFEGVDPQLEKAARVLGLPEWAVFLRVTLPLAWRGILAGVLLAFARALGEFGATLMVAGSIPGRTETMSIAVYQAVQAGQDALANTLVLIMSATCIAVLLGAGHLAPGRRSAADAMIFDIDVAKTVSDGSRRFDLRVRFRSPSRRTVIYGPSGAGKSLTLQAIAGLLRPDSRTHRGRRRRRLRQRARHRRAGAGQALRLSVPGLRAVPAPEREAEHRVRAEPRRR